MMGDSEDRLGRGSQPLLGSLPMWRSEDSLLMVTHIFFPFLVCLSVCLSFETGSFYVAICPGMCYAGQAGLRLPPKYWD